VSARRHTIARAGALLALGVAVSACSPPRSVSVGTKDVATDILLRDAVPSVASTTAAPPPVLTPGLPFAPVPRSVQPIVRRTAVPSSIPLPSTLPSTTPPSVAPPVPLAQCPAADPLVGPAVTAPPRATQKPVPGAYTYRQEGTFTISGAGATKGSYPASSVRTIKDVADVDGGYRFTVADDQGLSVGYTVIPEQRGQTAVGTGLQQQQVPLDPGIYIDRFSYLRADRTTLDIVPAPALKMARLPLTSGDKWLANSVDAVNGLTITLNGQTGLGPKLAPAKAKVDACGTVLDAWWVEYTVNTTPYNQDPSTSSSQPSSEIKGSDLDVLFVGTRMAFGTQYGGFPLEEVDVIKGSDGQSTVDIRKHATITRPPAMPGGSP
jgi:hypothetical protein